MTQRAGYSTPVIWAVSLSVLLIIWFVAATVAESRALPTPQAVLAALITEARSGELFYHLGKTLLRVIAAFLVAMFIGSAIGIALGMRSRLNDFFDPWVILFLNIPALVVIVLSYVWFGLTELAAIGAVAVNKIPNVVVTLREGARALDSELAEVSRVFKFSRLHNLRHVILPQLQPFFAAATRSGVSLIWKIVLVVELLGRSNGVGFQIHLYFQLFDVATILAYTFSFVAVMLVVEFVVLQRLDNVSSRWRRSHA